MHLLNVLFIILIIILTYNLTLTILNGFYNLMLLNRNNHFFQLFPEILKALEGSEIYKILLGHNPSECGPGYKYSFEDEVELASMDAAFFDIIKDICNTYEDYEAYARRILENTNPNNLVALDNIELFRNQNTALYNARMNYLTVRHLESKKIVLDRCTVNWILQWNFFFDPLKVRCQSTIETHFTYVTSSKYNSWTDYSAKFFKPVAKQNVIYNFQSIVQTIRFNYHCWDFNKSNELSETIPEVNSGVRENVLQIFLLGMLTGCGLLSLSLSFIYYFFY